VTQPNPKNKRSSFPPLYWLVVLFEFFERGSYYGMMSVLSVYMTDVLSFAKQDVGVIKATIQPLLYFLPILSGALADRFGYRRTLMVAFALLGSGYFLTSQATQYTWVFLALVVMGLGAGTFKPVISGAIARCTDKSNSTLGFGIYYWSINLGAFLFPLVLVPYLKNNVGWDWVIIASAIGTGAMLLPTIFVFREPPISEEERKKKEQNKTSLLQTLANAFEIIYSPFVLLLHLIRRSPGPGWLLLLLALGGTFGYGGWLFFRSPESSYMYSARVYRHGGPPLVIRVERNLGQQEPFLLELDGRRFTLTLYDPDRLEQYSRSLLAALHGKLLARIPADELRRLVSRAETDHTLVITVDPAADPPIEVTPKGRPDPKSKRPFSIEVRGPRATLTLRDPGRMAQLLAALKATSLPWVSEQDLRRYIADAEHKTTLAIAFDPSQGRPFRVSPMEQSRYRLTLTGPDVEAGRITQSLEADPRLGGLGADELAGQIRKAHNRPFFLPFVGLLLLASLVAIRLAPRFRAAAIGGKLALLVSLVGGVVALVWLLQLTGYLSLFGAILTTVIACTLSALFAIDHEEVAKFKDHFRFLSMIFLYSGFWVLYFQMFDSVLWYVKAYVDASSLDAAVNGFLAAIGLSSSINFRFDVEHVTVINAGTIILLQLVVSNIVKNTRALPTMVVGIGLGTLGMGILAISTGIWVFMLGITIFSIGEMTAHPKFISYVGQTAPKDRVAMYMGYIFLYGVIGSSIGSMVGANLYVRFVDQLNQPRTLWLIFTGIGVATIVGLLIYNSVVGRQESVGD